MVVTGGRNETNPKAGVHGGVQGTSRDDGEQRSLRAGSGRQKIGGGMRMLRRNARYLHPITRGLSLSGMPDQRVPDTMSPLERSGRLTGRS